jgi:hypothetical protein
VEEVLKLSLHTSFLQSAAHAVGLASSGENWQAFSNKTSLEKTHFLHELVCGSCAVMYWPFGILERRQMWSKSPT